MTSSGTFAFAPSNGEIVLSAFERIQIRVPEIRQEHMSSARREMNFMLVQLANFTPNLWEVVRTQTTLTQGTATYSLNVNTVMVLDASIVLNFGQSNESRRYITPISRSEYLTYANQQTPGPPTVWWMDRLISPTITFWPVPDGNGPYTFDYYSCTQIQDANLASGETPNVPYRWFDCLVAGLAHRLSRIYTPALEAIRKADADESWKIAATQDTEPVPTKFLPNLGGYYPR